jgi:hypothetical protein
LLFKSLPRDSPASSFCSAARVTWKKYTSAWCQIAWQAHREHRAFARLARDGDVRHVRRLGTLEGVFEALAKSAQPSRMPVRRLRVDKPDHRHRRLLRARRERPRGCRRSSSSLVAEGALNSARRIVGRLQIAPFISSSPLIPAKLDRVRIWVRRRLNLIRRKFKQTRCTTIPYILRGNRPFIRWNARGRRRT